MGQSDLEEDEINLPPKIKLAWGVGALGVSLLMNAISILILFYLVSVLKLDPILAGGVIFVSKILDVFSDPLVGVWSDRVTTPIGRRRPFLVWGAVISATSFVLIFTTPIFDNQYLTATYVFVALLVYTVGYTVFNVPYMAMPAEMTDSYHERSSIHAYRVVFVMLGGFLVGGLGNYFLEDMGRVEWSSYAILSVVGAAIILISMTATYYGTATARFTESGNAVPDIWADVDAVKRNKHFLRLLMVKMFQLLGVASSGATLIFFITTSLQLDLKILAAFFTAMTVASVIGAPLLVKLSKLIGKRSAYVLAASCFILYSLSWTLAEPGESFTNILIRAAFIGVAATGNILLAMSMLTDTIEYDATITGVRREGTYTAMYSFIEKLTSAFGPLIIGIVLSVAGFDKNLSGDEMQSESVQQALMFGIAYLPAILLSISILVLSGFKLDEKALLEAKESHKPKANL